MRYFNARTKSIAGRSARGPRSERISLSRSSSEQRLTFTSGLRESRRARNLHGKSHHGGTHHGDGNGENHGRRKPDRRQRTTTHRTRDPTSSMAGGTDTNRSPVAAACRPAAASPAY